MADGYVRFVRRHNISDSDEAELAHVDALALQLRAHVSASVEDIDRVHVHGAQSRAVQDVIGTLLTGLDFAAEHRIFSDATVIPAARPDFFFDLGGKRGIFVEVERGGTTTNNHDLKELWKTHLASYAQHLFLVVPYTNWNSQGMKRGTPFESARRRLSVFFGDERTEVDLLSLHLFAYGQQHDPVGRTRP